MEDWQELAGKGWKLLDVEEVPVALSPDSLDAVAFDPVARGFPAGSAFHKGTPISAKEFEELVAAEVARASP
jgi:hypothetical protein